MTMTDKPYQNQQQRYRQEDLMANGPVSRGASHEDAPMYTDEQTVNAARSNKGTQHKDQPDYNKMVQSDTRGPMAGSGMRTDQSIATTGRGTLAPAATSGRPRRGMNTSCSTVSG